MIEEELVPMCLSEGIGIITYNPLAAGMLTGRCHTGQEVEANSRFALSGVLKTGDLYQDRYWQASVLSAIEKYRKTVKVRPISPAGCRHS